VIVTKQDVFLDSNMTGNENKGDDDRRWSFAACEKKESDKSHLFSTTAVPVNRDNSHIQANDHLLQTVFTFSACFDKFVSILCIFLTKPH
jgi:hypothetical protein